MMRGDSMTRAEVVEKWLKFWEDRDISKAWKVMKKAGMSRKEFDAALDRIRDIDTSFLSMEKEVPDVVSFSYHGSKERNMNARHKDYVMVSPKWITTLMINEGHLVVEDAYRALVGHEHGHHIFQDDELFRARDYRIFQRYLNEVYADIKGLQLVFGGDRDRATKAMQWLTDHATKKNQKNSSHHPSRAIRQELAKDMEFNDDVINGVLHAAEAYLKHKINTEIVEELKTKFSVCITTGKSDADLESKSENEEQELRIKKELGRSVEKKIRLSDVKDIVEKQKVVSEKENGKEKEPVKNHSINGK